MSVSPQLYGGNCCCTGTQHGAVAVHPRYGWARRDWASVSTPTSAAEVRAACIRYKTKSVDLESGTPPVCFSAILPAALSVDPRTGQVSGTDWLDYLDCDSGLRNAYELSIESSTERLFQVTVYDPSAYGGAGGYVDEFVLRETVSDAWTDELMEDILDEILAEVNWGDVMLFDDAHNCHHAFRYDDSESVESFEWYDPLDFTPCSSDGAKALKLVSSGVAFYVRQDYLTGWGTTPSPLAAGTLHAVYADSRLDYADGWQTYGAKWAIHAREMRLKRSTRTLAFDTTIPPFFFWWAGVLTLPTWWAGTYTYGTASDVSATSCDTDHWQIDPPDGGSLSYPLSAFTVVARGTLAADLGY